MRGRERRFSPGGLLFRGLGFELCGKSLPFAGSQGAQELLLDGLRPRAAPGVAVDELQHLGRQTHGDFRFRCHTDW